MSSPRRGWTAQLSEDAAHTLKAMRAGGEAELHDQLVRFIRALAIEAGAATEAQKPLPGLPMGDGRYNCDVRGMPVLISYSRYPGLREIRVTDLLWLG
ncbi:MULTISPECIES: hypothetical protein [unclassified Streptomyces]|uniref:hypothetical protein n=1 Tax=unclassified Streptomyces TaxID=2593676 RepID=UPI002DDB5FF0|nr:MULTISPECIES: hypothetical protein [unclassified Streptomyces]WSA96861.1 hypothetical protein OIE63_38890 [Streptomyces sp. NBC_01795]WSB81277.1 hypothetical protein OHB04_40010 [Streptomyces sp. NBC_01775]WSS39209.1 hypothetical protein OG220_00265 [Streptomyces sp. NBC_01187]